VTSTTPKMPLVQRYRRLSFWSKIGLWGSVASLIGLPIAIWPLLAPSGEAARFEAVQREQADLDVSLRFIYPQSPALVLVNRSTRVAREIKWSAAFWNMDLPERNDPLPIPVQTFDWIQPGKEGGPQGLFAAPTVSSLIRPGDRLMGSVSVTCPLCKRGRAFVVWIKWGTEGWYAEATDQEGLLLPRRFLRENRERYFVTLEQLAPPAARIAITED
jgi:hypothetical protein